MDPKDAELLYDSIINEFRQALADCQLALARANAQLKVKDKIIAELTATANSEA